MTIAERHGLMKWTLSHHDFLGQRVPLLDEMGEPVRFNDHQLMPAMRTMKAIDRRPAS